LDGFAAACPDALNGLVLDNGAGHKAKAVRWPVTVMPVFLPPYSPELHPIARLWRDLTDTLSAIPVKTIEAWSAAMGALIQHDSHATLQSLTSLAYFVHAVKAVQKALYG
jgi:transposase